MKRDGGDKKLDDSWRNKRELTKVGVKQRGENKGERKTSMVGGGKRRQR